MPEQMIIATSGGGRIHALIFFLCLIATNSKLGRTRQKELEKHSLQFSQSMLDGDSHFLGILNWHLICDSMNSVILSHIMDVLLNTYQGAGLFS